MKRIRSTNKVLKIAVRGVLAAVILFCLVKVAVTSYDFGYRVFTETAVDEENGRDVIVTIKDDMSLMDIAKTLEEKGLVRDSRLFWIQVQLSVYRGKLQTGVYTLNTGKTPKELMQIMACETDGGE